MAKCGRRPVLNATKKDQIVAIIGAGCSRRTAAAYVGCAPATIQNTANRDPKFAERLRQAGYQAQIGYLKNIQNAARKEQYWRAAAWALERLNPEDFALPNPNQVAVDQMKQLMEQFAQIVTEEVHLVKTRKNILKRFNALIGRSERSKDGRSAKEKK